MPRRLRIEYPQAFYHVMNRGRGRCDIFHGDAYYLLFLDILSEASQRFGAVIHAYCLMSNHYHLILETPNSNLSRIMRHINGVYTQKYNQLRRSDGTLFRGRFKAILIDEDSYLTTLNRYIHKNPDATKVKLVKNLQDYKWSSYRSYLGLAPKPYWLNTTKTLNMLGIKNSSRKYKSFIESDNDKFITEFYSKENLPAIMGNMDFRDKISHKKTNINTNILQMQFTTKQVIKLVAKVFAVKEVEIISRQKGQVKSNFVRKLAMYLCQRYCGCKLQEVSNIFNLNSEGAISSALFHVKKELKGGKYRREILKIEDELYLRKRT